MRRNLIVVWLELRKKKIYIYIYIYTQTFFGNFFNIDELPVIVGVVMMFVVAAEFGGGAEMCEDFYFYYLR